MSKVTASRIKELRIRKGISQEELAGESGLNLRTIQRIENGETEPLGNSVKKIAHVLEITPEELIDWELDEDNSFLKALNISALTFLFFPILGIILPYILWRTKRNRVKGLNKIGREVVNFQITWSLIFYLWYMIVLIIMYNDPMSVINMFVPNIIFTVSMYVVNVSMILLNTAFIHTGRALWYHPKISFLRA